MKTMEPSFSLALTECLCIAAVIVSIGLPIALEHWTNEQVLNFMHLMWEQSNQSELHEERELDPLHFLPEGADPKLTGPLDASTVVEVAKRAFSSLGEYGESVFMRPPNFHRAFDSPLTEDAIMVEVAAAAVPTSTKWQDDGDAQHAENFDSYLGNGYTTEGLPKGPAKSFVATPSEPAIITVPDPARKKRIVDWLCQSIQHLNELSQIPFDSGELWRLHQHYFTPVVKEIGGSVPPRHESRSRMGQSLPDVNRDPMHESALSFSEVMIVDNGAPQSDPALSPPNAESMLKRKVSYRSLGDAALAVGSYHTPEVRFLSPLNGTISKTSNDSSMPPRNKRTRRNKTRISFLPRIQEKLDSLLDVCHEKALTLMRQLYYVEGALLKGDIFGNNAATGIPKATHLCGVLASEAEMIVLDMM
jgi:hypothetical protein